MNFRTERGESFQPAGRGSLSALASAASSAAYCTSAGARIGEAVGFLDKRVSWEGSYRERLRIAWVGGRGRAVLFDPPQQPQEAVENRQRMGRAARDVQIHGHDRLCAVV